MTMRQLAAAMMFMVPAFTNVQAADSNDLTLWYAAAANDWEREALPIGNGAMGAMVFGGIEAEQLQFNEKTLWTGGPGSVQGYDFGIPQRSTSAEVVQVASELERAGQISADSVASRLGRKTLGYGDYQSFGDVRLEFPKSASPVQGYRRELDLSRAVARVRFQRDGVHYQREYFASYPDDVIVMRLSADRPASVSLRLELQIPDNRSRHIEVKGRQIVVRGALKDNALEYATIAHVAPEGGSVSRSGDGIDVTNADAVVIILAAATNYRQHYPDYRGGLPLPVVAQRIARASQRSYEELLERHVADYRTLFDRVMLNIGQGTSTLPTDQLLSHYGTGEELDRTLEALYFQFGRYLLIASSRAGSLPANLQGLWNHSATPPWNADYHVNVNLQMNYWPAESTNLSETTAPLFDFIDALIPAGERSARQIVGARGWTVFLNTNIWGFAGVIAWPTAFWQPEAGAWLAQHYFEHYRFTGDERFLRERAWPVMKGAAQFWLDALRRDPRDGLLVVSPSYSPEHGPFTAGAAMSQQIVTDLFENVVLVAPRVGDAGFGQEIQRALDRLDRGLRIGSWGQLQEWKIDADDRTNTHRHVSHLFALHPGRQISLESQPELARAARMSLDARGDDGTGWSKAWKVNFWARLQEGDRAHKLLGEQLRASTLPNLFDTHPPFQIDGNFGATAGMAEMLLQSQHDEVHVLPALPKSWRNGEVKGLRARGDLTVDVRWEAGAAIEVKIRAGQSGPVALRSTLWMRDAELVDIDSNKALAVQGTSDRRTFPAESGHGYVLRVRR